jgi:hypothetical protein
MSFLKTFAAGFGIVLSLVVFTFVYAYLQAAPKEKATDIIFLLASRYYWLLLIVLVTLEARLLMRRRAG